MEFAPVISPIARLPMGLYGRGYLVSQLGRVARGEQPVSAWLTQALECPEVPRKLRPDLYALAADIERVLATPGGV